LENGFIPKEYGIPWTQFRIMDNIIQIRNNSEKHIFNGNLGNITHSNDDDHTATAKFGDEVVALNKGNLSESHLAYAISIHKSQGNEFPS
jgi:exodeoxyribonuclease V alpha subunit